MKIGVIGDVHTRDILLKKAIKHNSSSEIYCTGDLVSWDDEPGNVHNVITLIKDNNIKTVLGNHDDWLTESEDLSQEEYNFIKSLPTTIDIKTPCGLALLYHGIGERVMGKVNPDDYGYAIESNFELQEIIGKGKYKMIINGHSHRKMVRDIDGLKIINAGALVHDRGIYRNRFNGAES